MNLPTEVITLCVPFPIKLALPSSPSTPETIQALPMEQEWRGVKLCMYTPCIQLEPKQPAERMYVLELPSMTHYWSTFLLGKSCEGIL